MPSDSFTVSASKVLDGSTATPALDRGLRWVRMPSRTSQGKVESPPITFEKINHAQALLIVAEAARMDSIEARLAGMAEGRVAKIVAQGDGFDQILVEAQGPGDGAGNLGHF